MSGYILRDRITNKVEYVGRTKNIDATEIRHLNHPFRTNLKFDPVAKNISKHTVRGLEEALIQQCRTLNRIENQIFL